MRPPSTLLQLNAIFVLFCAAAMLFPNVADGQQDTLGLGGLPIPAKKGEIDLPSGTKLTKDKKEFKKYQHNDKTFEPCNVEFGEDGNIEVFYDDLASTKGCTLDLLVNIADDKDKQIKFMAKVEDKEKNCVTEDVSDNLLPFIFNEANNGLTTLTNGPIAGVEEDCANKEKCEKSKGKDNCIKRTMYDIAWSRDDKSIRGYLDQVGEPFSSVWYVSGKADGAKMDVKMAVGDVPGDKPLVTITALDVPDAKSVEFPDGIEDKKPVCNKPKMASPPPAIWKVNSEIEEFNGKYFVTFHFFPQKAARIPQTNQEPTGGPKCKGPKQPSFIFSAAGLLMFTPLPTKPTTPGTSTAPGSKTSIEPTTPGKSDGSSSTSTMNTTGSTTTPAATEPPPTGLGTLAIVGIVAGAIALVVVVAVLVYCLCFRGKGEADENEEEDEPAAAAEDEDVEKAEGELPAASV